MKKFEYKYVYKGRFDHISQRELDELGNEGWEMCGVEGEDYTYYYFKREKVNETERLHASDSPQR
jgi:hypothetical protein